MYFEDEFLKHHLHELKANPNDAGKEHPTKQVRNPCDLVGYLDTCVV